MRWYSHFFSTLHDEQEPVGKLGRGTHYSIFRAVLWDKVQPQWHDFAVVWDEDHDTRVIWVIEQLHIQRLLRDVLAIGERKGGITIVTRTPHPNRALLALSEKGWSPPDGDYFCSNVEHVDDATALLINDTPARVQAYVKGIDALWNLGTKPIAQDPHPLTKFRSSQLDRMDRMLEHLVAVSPVDAPVNEEENQAFE
jgi:hypothetical protein